MMHYVLGRLREPSTYAGIALFLASAAGFDPTTQVWWEHAVQIMIGLSGLAAALVPDRSSRIAKEIEAKKVGPGWYAA